LTGFDKISPEAEKNIQSYIVFIFTFFKTFIPYFIKRYWFLRVLLDTPEWTFILKDTISVKAFPYFLPFSKSEYGSDITLSLNGFIFMVKKAKLALNILPPEGSCQHKKRE